MRIGRILLCDGFAKKMHYYCYKSLLLLQCTDTTTMQKYYYCYCYCYCYYYYYTDDTARAPACDSR